MGASGRSYSGRAGALICRMASYNPPDGQADRDRSRALPPLRWLSGADVIAAMPPLEERLRLAELTMTALARPGGQESHRRSPSTRARRPRSSTRCRRTSVATTRPATSWG